MAGSRYSRHYGSAQGATLAASCLPPMPCGECVSASSRPGRPSPMNDGNITMETGKHDWRRFDALSDAEVHAAALNDPDAQPLTDAALARMKPVARARPSRSRTRTDAGGIRRALSHTHRHLARLGAGPRATRSTRACLPHRDCPRSRRRALRSGDATGSRRPLISAGFSATEECRAERRSAFRQPASSSWRITLRSSALRLPPVGTPPASGESFRARENAPLGKINLPPVP
jgi:hypothetical protein